MCMLGLKHSSWLCAPVLCMTAPDEIARLVDRFLHHQAGDFEQAERAGEALWDLASDGAYALDMVQADFLLHLLAFARQTLEEGVPARHLELALGVCANLASHTGVQQQLLTSPACEALLAHTLLRETDAPALAEACRLACARLDTELISELARWLRPQAQRELAQLAWIVVNTLHQVLLER